jgi:hypothetical protein
MNKHGFKGVLKHTSPRHSRKPFYARVTRDCRQFVSRHFETAAEAAAEYNRRAASPMSSGERK